MVALPTAFAQDVDTVVSDDAEPIAESKAALPLPSAELIPYSCVDGGKPHRPQQRAPLADTSACSLYERTKLSGDWWGHRPLLREAGYTLDVSNTQFYQGVAAGGRQRAFEYGGRNDYFLNIDGSKAGLAKGSIISLHGETRYGESANGETGSAMAPSMIMSLPVGNRSVTALTGVKFTQFLSETSLVYAGKINTLDGVTQPLTGATVLSGFMNTGLNINPVVVRTSPYSAFGAGYVFLHEREALLSYAVLDTNDTPTTSGFETFFNNGVVNVAKLNLPTEFLGRPGHQGISGFYSTGSYLDLQPTVFVEPILPSQVSFGQRSGSWCVMYNFDQALYVDPTESKRRWGIFGNVGLADKNPSPVHWSANCGIAGYSPFACRSHDTFGIGYFHLAPTPAARALINPYLPVRDEYGVEAYHNFALNPWCQVTPDLQVLRPVRENLDSALVLGVRAKIDF